MALLALVPQLSFVALAHVVLAMTGNTFLMGVTKLDFGGVATFTFGVDFLVSPLELVAGTVMVEFFLLDDRNVGFSAFVLAMTVATGCVFEVAMPPCFCGQIFANRLVAIRAKPCLGLLVKALVA